MSAPRVRFAPSPTGSLHIGGARTALFNWLLARGRGGVFVLRIEDTDAVRSTEESAASILRDLRALGLDWDEGPGVDGPHAPYFQSERAEHYRRAADALLAAGAAYRSFQSAEELARIREAREAGASADPTARYRAAPPEEEAERLARGEPHAVVFRLPAPDGETRFADAIRGDVRFANAEIGDFVLVKSDGRAAYNFAAAVDDHAMGITHVIRGEDHLSNTPKQLHVYRALGLTPPAFGHLPLILGPDRSRLSKRHGATSVQNFLELGILPEALVNYLALLGWSAPDGREILGRDELVALFSLERVGKTGAAFDTEKLTWTNGRHLAELPVAERACRVCDLLAERGLAEPGETGAGVTPARAEALVDLVGERMRTIPGFLDHAGFFFTEEPEAAPEDVAKALAKRGDEVDLDDIAARLEGLPAVTPEAIEGLFRGLAEETGLKLRVLMGPVRLAVTGLRNSPDLFTSIALLGAARSAARLRAFARRHAGA